MAQKILVIGAVALGPKAACRAKRLSPDSQITLIDEGEFISYGGCGIPYYVSGDVSESSELRSTSFHMVRDVDFFKNDKGIDVLTRTKAVNINRDTKTVDVRKPDGMTDTLAYDQLILATGAAPRKLNIKGCDLDNVFTVANIEDAEGIKAKVAAQEIEKAVIVGAGFIGLEMAEALADMWDIDTTVIEFFDQIMPRFVSANLAQMAMRHMEEKGVTFCLSEKVQEIKGGAKAEKVITDKREIDADLVILATGVSPRSELAKNAGLEVSPMGGIRVNLRMQTSDPDIYAGGDCVCVQNLITEKEAYFPLGSMANRQGRVIGTNITGGDAEFQGAVGSFVVKTFENSLSGAGLTIEEAIREGFDAVSVQAAQFDRSHFYPDKDIINLELVVEKKTKRVLGIQGYGPATDSTVSRVNAVAAILDQKPAVDRISNLELAYSPPFSSAMDIINALGNVAENILEDRCVPVDQEGFAEIWVARGESDDYCVLDCRAEADGKPFEEKYAPTWKSIPHDQLRARMQEVPKDKKIILVCNTGVRSYEAQLDLRHRGIGSTFNLSGGMSSLKKWGIRFD